MILAFLLTIATVVVLAIVRAVARPVAAFVEPDRKDKD